MSVFFFSFLAKVSAQPLVFSNGKLEFSSPVFDPITGYAAVDVIWKDFRVTSGSSSTTVAIHPRFYVTIKKPQNGNDICIDEDLTFKSMTFNDRRLEIGKYPPDHVELYMHNGGTALYLNTNLTQMKVATIYFLGPPGGNYFIEESIFSISLFELEHDDFHLDPGNSAAILFQSLNLSGEITRANDFYGTTVTCSAPAGSGTVQGGITNVNVAIDGFYDMNVCLSNFTGIGSLTTANTGIYETEVYKGMTFDIRPSKNNDIDCGMDAADLDLVRDFILGVYPNPSSFPLQFYLAADIDNNKTVNTYDQLLMQKIILGLFPNCCAPSSAGFTSWIFVPEVDYYANNPLPTAVIPALPDLIHHDLVQFNNLNNQNFIGVKKGDVIQSCTDCNMQFQNPLSEDRDNVETVKLYIPAMKLNKGQEVEIPIYTSGLNATTLVFGLLFDNTNLEVLEVRQSSSEEKCLSNFAIDNSAELVKAISSLSELGSMTDDSTTPLYWLKVKALSNIEDVRSLFSVENDAFLNESVQNGVFAGRFEFVENVDYVSNKIQLFPNPTFGNLSLTLDIEKTSISAIHVFDNMGRLLLHKTVSFEKGKNLLLLDTEQFESGCYQLRLTTESGFLSKSFIKI